MAKCSTEQAAILRDARILRQAQERAPQDEGYCEAMSPKLGTFASARFQVWLVMEPLYPSPRFPLPTETHSCSPLRTFNRWRHSSAVF